jgi:hypothetical protein
MKLGCSLLRYLYKDHIIYNRRVKNGYVRHELTGKKSKIDPVLN